MNKILKSVGIHDGPFHADEVTACGLLLLHNLIDLDKIVRTRSHEKLKLCEYVCDVGGVYDPSQKLFDHHQANYKGTESSAGMVLDYLKSHNFIDQAEWNFFRDSLIKGVDDHDNGKSPQIPGVCTFSLVIANFSPISYEATEEEQNRYFFKALDFAYGHLKRLRERYLYNIACRDTVREAMLAYKTCLIFDRELPWQESFFALGGDKHPALFVIMPSGHHWKLRGIPPTLEKRMQVRLPLPEEWAGLLEKELKEATGINGAVFCHKGRFTSVWETKDEALIALNQVLKKNGIQNYDNPV